MSEQRVAVITGGTGGLGTATVRRLAQQGHLLAVTYLIPEEAAALEEKLHLGEQRLVLRRVDVTDPEAVNEFMKLVAERFGAIHIVCSFVGGWAGGRDVEETDDIRFERMVDLNLRSAFHTVRAAIPYLRRSRWGRILLVGSRAAEDTPPGQGAYNLAKAGVIALAKTVAQELGEANVTSNALVPSVIDTPATRAAMPFADYVDWPSPDQIAAVVEFLVSEEAGVISGATIPVYGKA
ncbi:MAG: SDR family oxidoreductase [Actinomycetota bacterium]|nr:SDR family oxidoreductase [Actinomycetota bacterium]